MVCQFENKMESPIFRARLADVAKRADDRPHRRVAAVGEFSVMKIGLSELRHGELD